jgi:glycine dehydrogenase subunit 1
MEQIDSKAHPYMPNSAGEARAEMLSAIGIPNIEELFDQIPEKHRLSSPLDLPDQLSSELDLKRHLLSVLARNSNCEATLSFLGAGCWQHHVPAICDEIVGRAEFLTNVWGTPSSDHGRNQALFEFCSQLGELLKLDMVGLPVYSYGCAVGHAIRMASRINGRRKVLVPKIIDPERGAVIANYCEPKNMAEHIEILEIDYDDESGNIDVDHLKQQLSEEVTAIYFEVPNYFGLIEKHGKLIAELASAKGAEVIVGCDPISLGILRSPVDYGADIVVGPVQPLGVHMNCGGGVSGFIASRDSERYVREYNTLNISITETDLDGQYGFGLSSAGQTSYGLREAGNDWTGNSTYLWAIAGAVYMSLLGPSGFREVGELIIQQSNYAAKILSEIDGVKVVFNGSLFKEFVLNFDETRLFVKDINAELRNRNIFGGKDLSVEFPELGQSALYCVTEVHTQQDIDYLARNLKGALL